MKNGKKSGSTTTTETTHVETVMGRPVSVTSKRQAKLIEMEVKRQLGLVKKGRPVNTDSDRQKRLAELQEKRDKGELKPGRPAYTAEQKEAADKIREAKAKVEADQIKVLAAQYLKDNNIAPVTEG